MEDPRKFEIKNRTTAKDEETKSKTKKAVVAGLIILGAGAGIVLCGEAIDSSAITDLASNPAVSFAVAFAGIRGFGRMIAKARENSKKKKVENLFTDEQNTVGGNEDVRTK